MEHDDKDGCKRPLGADLVIPLLAAAFAVYYVTTIWNLPWEAKANGLVLAAILLVLLVLFALSVLRALRRGDASLSLMPLVEPLRFQKERWGLVVFMVLFIALIRYLGFTLTIFFFLVAAMLLLGVRTRKKLILTAAIAALAGYLMFIVALDTPFPYGPFEHLFEGLL